MNGEQTHRHWLRLRAHLCPFPHKMDKSHTSKNITTRQQFHCLLLILPLLCFHTCTTRTRFYTHCCFSVMVLWGILPYVLCTYCISRCVYVCVVCTVHARLFQFTIYIRCRSLSRTLFDSLIKMDSILGLPIFNVYFQCGNQFYGLNWEQPL